MNWMTPTAYGRAAIRPVPNRCILQKAAWNRQERCYPDMVSTIGNRREENLSAPAPVRCDTVNQGTKLFMQQSMAAFGGNAPICHIVLLDKLTII